MEAGGFLMGTLSIGVGKTAVMIYTGVLLLRVLSALRARASARWPGLGEPAERASAQLLLWGLLAFGLSELTCGVEIYLVKAPLAYLRVVHSAASAVGAGLLLYAVLRLIDRRVLHVLDESGPCVAETHCKGCPRRSRGRCRFRPAIGWLLGFMAVMAVPLLFAPVAALTADPTAVPVPFEGLRTFFDESIVPAFQAMMPEWTPAELYFVIPEEMSFVEFRVLPLCGAALALTALGLLLFTRADRLAFLLTCLAAGALGFAYLEAVVYLIIPWVYVGSLGHEVAELFGLVLLTASLDQLVGRPQ
jgi:hypothetical protein